MTTSQHDKSARLREALLRVQFEQAIAKYETDTEFRTTVQRIRDSIIEGQAKTLADTIQVVASHACTFLLRDLKPILFEMAAATESAQVFTYRLERLDVVPGDLAVGALAWAEFPLYLAISPEPDQGKTRIRVKLYDTVGRAGDISGGKCALQVDFEYQHEPLWSFTLSEERYDVDTVVSVPIDCREDFLVKISLASSV